MKIFLSLLLLALIFAAGAAYYFYPTLYGIIPGSSNIPKLNTIPQPISSQDNLKVQSDVLVETIVVEGLDTPWAIAFLPARSASSTADAGGPNGDMLVTERKGTVRLVTKNGDLQTEPVSTLSNVKEIGEGGLLGIALHPDFLKNNFVYFYYTYSNDGENTLNRVIRMKYENEKLTDEQIIVDKIPGASNHNGGRVKFGPDGNLYITTGDAQEPSLAQDKTSLAGKILRVTAEGKPAPGNPFGDPVYSYGHRNPQGIAWGNDGTLWETEHGQMATDEINRIEPGKNYGWPIVTGDQTKDGMVSPLWNSRKNTWAPGDIAFFRKNPRNYSVFFGGLRGQALYEINFDGDNASEQIHFSTKFGRIREVITGPDGMLYITTSNRDGRGVPKPEDDRIIRVNPSKL